MKARPLATTWPRSSARLLAVPAVGAVVALLLARTVGASWRDAFVLVALAGAGSALAVAGTVVALRRSPHRSLTGHVFVVALGAVAATAAGVGLAAWAMFLSAHDLGVLAVVLVLSATVAGTASWALGASVRSGVAAIAAQVEALRDDRPAPARPEVATGELARLSVAVAAAHTELAAARQLAARLEGSRRELVAWVSHDLRSPISAVRAMAEALEDGVVVAETDVAAYHRAIRTETDRLARLVDDLFELSRIEAGATDLDVSLVPVTDLVAEVVAAARLRADAHDVTLVAALDGLRPRPGLVIASDIRRAIDNVLDNAIRHTPPGGAVELEVATGGRDLVLAVRDQCGGIPADDLGRIFDVAFRGDASRSRNTGGGGLGLAIAKGLLEAREGRITVRNHNPGCEFTLRLPATVTP